MSQNHRIKGGTTDEEFKEQCSLWERGVSVATYFVHEQLFKTMKKTKKYLKSNLVEQKNGNDSHLRSWNQTFCYVFFLQNAQTDLIDYQNSISYLTVNNIID